MRIHFRPARLVALAGLSLLAACERPGGCRGDYCGTLVFAATGQPDILFPIMTQSGVSGDIVDQMFLKLADIGMSENTIGDKDFEPNLARSWTWEDSLTLVFHLDPRARWHDGAPVTAADVAFTFGAYTDPKVNAPARAAVRSIASVTARDSLTAVFTFRTAYAEMFFDAVFHMRILPQHLLAALPREQWGSAAFGQHPVGDGPYRFVEWKAGESVELAADSTFFLGRPHIRRLIWRFAPEQEVALTQMIAGEADALEFLGPPPSVERAKQATQIKLYPYPATAYGYLAFNFRANGDTTRPHPILADADVRRALFMAVDREKLFQSVWGDFGKVPPGPMPRIWSIWDSTLHAPPYDTTQAAALLTARGWRDSDGDGIRDRGGRKLAFHLLVLTTSGVRKQYARLLQEQFRAIGAQVEIDEVDNTVMEERGKAGKFDAALASWRTDPAPSASVAQTWTRGGFGASNYGRYYNPAFDQALARAQAARTAAAGQEAWRAVFGILNQDVPGIWLYSPDLVAGVHSRIADVRIRPDSWWALVRTWRIPSNQLIDRDRVER